MFDGECWFVVKNVRAQCWCFMIFGGECKCCMLGNVHLLRENISV